MLGIGVICFVFLFIFLWFGFIYKFWVVMGIVETYKINPFAAVSIELEVKIILFPISSPFHESCI
jgi:hypothetical protein